MRLRFSVAAAAIVFVLASPASPQSQRAANPFGVWRGTSSCTVRPSPCHDEIVVYRITRAKTRDGLSLDARKIVSGREEEMGVLACVAVPNAQITCAMRNGAWHFAIRGDSLVGELRLADDTKYRDVRTIRSRGDAPH